MPAYLVTTPQGSPAPLKSHLPPVSSSVPLSIPELLCKILRRHTLFFTAFPDFNNTKPQTSAACYVSNRSIKKGGMSRTFPRKTALALSCGRSSSRFKPSFPDNSCQFLFICRQIRHPHAAACQIRYLMEIRPRCPHQAFPPGHLFCKFISGIMPRITVHDLNAMKESYICRKTHFP